jgi:hypothetical protein
MSRARSADDIEFGSDSFLDVVANIVGILIILIVVAGAKAGLAPVSARRLEAYLNAQRPAPSAAEETDTSAGSPTAAPAAAAPPAGPRVIPISPDLARQAEALAATVSRDRTAAQSLAAALEADVRRRAELERVLGEQQRQLASANAALDAQVRSLGAEQARLASRKKGLLQIETDVERVEADRPAPKAIRHKLTPLSQEVQGKELHFRLAENRVARVPVEELIDRLRPQIVMRKTRLLHEGLDRGQVGPVGGFRMDYVVEVQRRSMVEDLQRGGAVTIGVSQWRVVPEPDLETESAEEALRPGSAFLRTLRGADADATLTFWVYPDSFELYRKLQEFAHAENFTVAARPLPAGVPIAGSPMGSRSNGQ